MSEVGNTKLEVRSWE